MNEPIKILFDENFGEPLVSALAVFLDWYEESVEIRHLFKFAKASEKDEVWVPRIAPGGWTVISTDRAKRCGGKRLPDLCREYAVTHILLSASIHEAKQFEKMRAFIAVWPRIILAAKCNNGTRFSLRYDGPDKRVALVERPYADHRAASGASPVLGFDGRKTKRQKSSRHRQQKQKGNANQMILKWNNAAE